MCNAASYWCPSLAAEGLDRVLLSCSLRHWPSERIREAVPACLGMARAQGSGPGWVSV